MICGGTLTKESAMILIFDKKSGVFRRIFYVLKSKAKTYLI